MPLDQNALADAIEAIYADFPETASDAAEALAGAYADYALQGVFGASTLAPIGTEEPALFATLGASLVLPGAAAVHAAAWSAGVGTFWAAVPVVGVQAGTTAGCPGAAALTAGLTTLFLNLANTPETAAAGLAAALHTATQTVTANVAPPPGTVLPIA